jgi:iron-sulfur cluster assembly accessory protein
VSYTMNYATSKGKFDEEVEVGGAGGVKVFIEPSALLKIAGTTMDWKEDDTASEFVFENPNAKAICGCGESFNV